jgi:enamine deaminase RidA (YjgF/YER057c/UK114 family)
MDHAGTAVSTEKEIPLMNAQRADDPETALRRLGLELPSPPPPVANYRAWTREGPLLFVSGQVSTGPQGDLTGTVGESVSLAGGIAAAWLCGLNILSQMKEAAGDDLGRIQFILKLSGYVQAALRFSSIPQVMDGCLSLLLDMLGEAGIHARSAIGVAELPRGCLVEADAIARLGHP